MSKFEQLLTAVRTDSDHATLPAADALRTAGQRRTLVRRGVGSAVALVIAVGLTAVAVRVAPSVRNSPISTPTASPTPSKYALIRGRVTVNGQPLAGASIRVSIQPNSEIADSLKVGDSVPTLQIAPAVSGPDGRYEVVVRPEQITADFHEPQGPMIINTEVTVDALVGGSPVRGTWASPDSVCPSSPSTSPTPSPSSSSYWCADGADDYVPHVMDFDFGAKHKVRDNGYFDDEWHDLPG